MDSCLRYVEKKAQGKISEDILLAKPYIPKVEEIKNIPYQKGSVSTKEDEKQKFRELNGQRKENISLNKIKDKQSLSSYKKEIQKFKNIFFQPTSI